jgi:hypothetical protein
MLIGLIKENQSERLDMYAITADQIDSRHGTDLADDALALIAAASGGRLALPADRTAGDEVQGLTADADTALAVVLALLRTGSWSVGLGIGDVETPLPTATRAARGPAFIAARDAVDGAKRRPTRFAALGDDGITQPLVDLLLALRDRRTPEGWELFDLVEAGLSQQDAAQRLGITPQAASRRALAAGIRLDQAARRALVAVLAAADLRATRAPGSTDVVGDRED